MRCQGICAIDWKHGTEHTAEFTPEPVRIPGISGCAGPRLQAVILLE
ncbi:hypothetical protein ALCH109712_05910 [Alkalicoccus chagannorensis]